MQAVAKSRRAREDGDFAPARAHGGYGHAITIALIVIAAFAVRYWFNFVTPHVNNYGAADASEYLRNGQLVYNLKNMPMEFWQQCWQVLQGDASAATIESVRSGFAPMKEFAQGGPIFPLFLASSFAIAGVPYDQLNWQVPLMGQSIFSALTCGLIALTAALAFSRPAGYVAGLTAICYPAFIVNSGRLYSESHAAFLLSLVCYLTVRGLCIETGYARAFAQSLLNGIVSMALQLARSVLVLVTLALVPITFLQYGFKKGMVALVGLLLGFALVAAPWLAFQKLAFGTTSLVVNRVGNYNFFIGNNVDTAGWLSFPYPDGSGVNEKSMTTLAKEAIEKNPRRWLSLQEDKPLRLFKFPWNDFRTPIGDIEFKWQVLFHQIVMLLALIGAALGFTASRRKGNDPDFDYERSQRLPKDATSARMFLLFVFCVHFAYLFFITVPRYNLTAMPIAIIFAGAGVTAIARLFVARNGLLPACSLLFVSFLIFAAGMLNIPAAFATAFGAKATFWGYVFQQGLLTVSVFGLLVFLATAISALAPKNPFQTRRPAGAGLALATVVVAGILLLPLCVVPAAANGRWYEWKYPFDSTSLPVTQQLNLPASISKDLAGRQLYLMIDADGDESLTSSAIDVNGKRLAMPVIPSIAFAEDFSRLIPSRGVSMREGEWIFSCMTESAAMRNSDLRQWFLIPLPADTPLKPGINNIKLAKTDSQKSTIFGSYRNGKDAQHLPSISSYSWEKAFYGVENPEGFSDTRYEMRVPAATIVQSDLDLSGERGLQTGSYNIRLLASAPVLRNDSIYTVERPNSGSASITPLRSTPTSATLIHDVAPKFSLPIKELPSYTSNDVWLVRVHGNVRRNGGTAKLAVSVKSHSAGQTYSSGWAPTMKFGTETKTFDFAVPLQPTILGGLKDVEILFNVKDPAAAGDDVQKAAGVNELRDLRVEILKLPVNPLNPGHLVL